MKTTCRFSYYYKAAKQFYFHLTNLFIEVTKKNHFQYRYRIKKRILYSVFFCFKLNFNVKYIITSIEMIEISVFFV